MDMAAPTLLDTFREDQPLTKSIVIITRPVHAKLNKLIIARLPLALPPVTTSPLAYATGMMHVAPIFRAFEAAWSDLLEKPDPSKVSQHLLAMLRSLHLPGLMRADRLEADVRSVMGWTDAELREHLDRVGETGHLGDFTSHIKRAIESKPHVLVSYAYILFMALFAGGRFIRATLESAGEDFWQGRLDGRDSQQQQQQLKRDDEELEASSPPTQGMPLRFFHFNTPMDGEDLKQEFKQRLAGAEDGLGYQKKRDIVQEAICIFENLTLVVAQIDDVLAAARDTSQPSSADEHGSATSPTTPIPGAASFIGFRDSIAVAKERSARRSSQEVHDRGTTRHADVCAADSGREKDVKCPAYSKSVSFGDADEDLCKASKRRRRDWMMKTVGIAPGIILVCFMLVYKFGL
ncbi:hypothetical protein E4U42_002797 [Claviceps africana]|uniref:Heme oxygenase n=1 Tax=Claviceps africana TaxID=83212 RepID=A0A8K0JDQ7_9HYPO|nr:hypothetical protein E4U42_002797 [Claviceps africana]